jgi:hypothetical protein
MDENKLKELNELNSQIAIIKKEKYKLANFISIVNKYTKEIDNGENLLSVNLTFYGQTKSYIDIGTIGSAKELNKKIFEHSFSFVENILQEVKKEKARLEKEFKEG